jgi:hypothetical protein
MFEWAQPRRRVEGHTADDEVDLAELLDRALRGGLQLRRHAHVRLQRDTLLARLRRELLRGRLEAVHPSKHG